MRLVSASWQARAAAKREDTLNKIYPEWRLSPIDLARAKEQRNLTGSFIQQFLQTEEISIISRDSIGIVDAIKKGELTAVQVTSAFCKTAAIAHQIALERAAWLDAHFSATNSPVGPLHGLPVSLKDQFHVRGVDTTMGYVGWIGSNLGIRSSLDAHQVESQITTELLSLGAVLYCKTSLPQTLLFAETKNNIIGQTLNPNNQHLSCGGSSGGEGALQALRGSTLGIGTDIGGSVRIPAAFNGVFALKPTPERLPYRCVANNNPGQNVYRSTIGFLSTSLGGLDLLLRSELSTKPWLRDPEVVPLPFRDDIASEYESRANPDGTAKASAKPLKLGVLWTDCDVQPHPPITRGLRIVVEAMRGAGHEVVYLDFSNHFEIGFKEAEIADLAFLMADGAHDIHTQLDLSGEPLIPDLEASFQLRDPINLLQYQDLTVKGLEYESAYSDYWNSTADNGGKYAVIMPAAPHAAVIPGKYYHTGYTEVINLLNYSVVVIPVTKANKDIDVIDKSYEPSNELDGLNWEAYDPEIYDGAPVGLQLVARKFEEEKILSIAKIVVAALETARKGVPTPLV
ncbi:hypothetical protein EKO27_g6644 [Xylaria grammica]|uniref:Amidase domain-containing protein n=1 Tax=Xylaria grammica TaxID=363999 RepID=A0A439D1Z9_9PEZI|nr:hypothetical protein EKO27_g6644 [Xylaria grammica]